MPNGEEEIEEAPSAPEEAAPAGAGLGGLASRGGRAAGRAAKKAAQRGAQLAANAAKAIVAMGPWGWLAVGIIVVCFIILLILFITIMPCLAGKCGKTLAQATNLTEPNHVQEIKELLNNIKTDLTLSQEKYAQDVEALKRKIVSLEPRLGTLTDELKQKYQQIKDQVEQLEKMDPTAQKQEIIIILNDLQNKGIEFFNSYIINSGVQGVKEYADLNKRATGHALRLPGPSGQFFAHREPNRWRRVAGRHNGYDLFAAGGTPVVAGWDGTITSYYPTSKGWAIDSGDFIVTYLHIIVDPELKVGDRVTAGQVIGTIGAGASWPRSPHVDIKMKRKSDGRFVDWGKTPWQVPENGQTPTWER